MAESQTCLGCDSFRNGKDGWGECHHGSPVIIQSVPAVAKRYIGKWPAVQRGWSCSKWFGTITLQDIGE